jgi:glucosyl-dolichyl phosphate glucuronosyltransferase
MCCVPKSVRHKQDGVFGVNISMVVCTFNRLNLLQKTISSLLAQTICRDNKAQWEIIIVDNNCTDGTAEYVKGVAITNPKVTYVLEQRQGLGYARNAGAKATQYEIIAFIDDDEWADNRWAEEIIRVYEENDQAGCVGGPYYLENQEQIPFWISPNMYGVLGDVWLNINQDDYCEVGRITLGGGNLSIRKDAYNKTSGFLTEKGRRGDVLLADEDRHMCYEIYDLSFRLFYNPKAIAFHALIPARLTFGYFLRNIKGMAYTRAQKKKVIIFMFELVEKTLMLPIKIMISPRNGLHHLTRLVSAWFKLSKSVSMVLKDLSLTIK